MYEKNEHEKINDNLIIRYAIIHFRVLPEN